MNSKQDFFNSPLKLENEELLIRPLQADDFNKIESICYTTQLGEFGERVKDRNDLKRYFNYCESAKSRKELYPLIIIEKKEDKAIGVTMLGNIDFANKRLEIGWTWIAKNKQGTGLNQSCKRLLINYCFEQLNLRRIEFKVDIENIKSQKAIEKNGAIKEGLLRNYNVQSYGESEGTYIYSIIKEDWN